MWKAPRWILQLVHPATHMSSHDSLLLLFSLCLSESLLEKPFHNCLQMWEGVSMTNPLEDNLKGLDSELRHANMQRTRIWTEQIRKINTLETNNPTKVPSPEICCYATQMTAFTMCTSTPYLQGHMYPVYY